MTLFRLLNVQGIAGIAASIALAILLLVQKGETSHWKKQSAGFEQLYTKEQASFAGTVASYGAAAETARATDEANAERVASEQSAINERISHDYEARLAAARARAQQLRIEAPSSSAHSGGGGAAPVPALPTATSGPAQDSSQDRLPDSDALTATEQAIQRAHRLGETTGTNRSERVAEMSPTFH